MEAKNTQMDSVLLQAPGRDQLSFGQIDRPVPGSGQVLIKVESVPINPTDLYMMEGKYGKYADFKYPFTPGFEGSGTVIESGGGLLAWRIKDKRVAFTRMDTRMAKGEEVTIGGSMAQY